MIKNIYTITNNYKYAHLIKILKLFEMQKIKIVFKVIYIIMRFSIRHNNMNKFLLITINKYLVDIK